MVTGARRNYFPTGFWVIHSGKRRAIGRGKPGWPSRGISLPISRAHRGAQCCQQHSSCSSRKSCSSQAQAARRGTQSRQGRLNRPPGDVPGRAAGRPGVLSRLVFPDGRPDRCGQRRRGVTPAHGQLAAFLRPGSQPQNQRLSGKAAETPSLPGAQTKWFLPKISPI